MLFNTQVLNFVEPGSDVPGLTEEPIRAELLSAERMENHAESLAAVTDVINRFRRLERLPAGPSGDQ